MENKTALNAVEHYKLETTFKDYLTNNKVIFPSLLSRLIIIILQFHHMWIENSLSKLYQIQKSADWSDFPHRKRDNSRNVVPQSL